jgi:hypothetical protein
VGSEAGGVVTAVTPSREALAKALCVLDYDCPEGEDWCESCDHGGGYRRADRLIASGAVVPLDTLADDEALPVVAHKGPDDTDRAMFLRAAYNLENGYPLGGGNLTRAVVALIQREVARADRALAAALSERGDR